MKEELDEKEVIQEIIVRDLNDALSTISDMKCGDLWLGGFVSEWTRKRLMYTIQ